MIDTSAQERARAVIAQGAAYASAWMLVAIREMELKAVSGDVVADFIADALTEAKRQGAEEMRELFNTFLQKIGGSFIQLDIDRGIYVPPVIAEAIRDAARAISPDGGDRDALS